MKVEGFSDLSKKLEELKRNVQKLGETKQASLADILTPEFVSQHTRFANGDDLFAAGGFNISSQQAFESIPLAKLDAFVSAESGFESWNQMLSSAGAQWAKQQVIKGL